jgi:hypothetical protein
MVTMEKRRYPIVLLISNGPGMKAKLEKSVQQWLHCELESGVVSIASGVSAKQ